MLMCVRHSDCNPETVRQCQRASSVLLMQLGCFFLQDNPMPIGNEQTISAPHMHAACLDLLADQLQPGASALDVGSGSGCDQMRTKPISSANMQHLNDQLRPALHVGSGSGCGNA